MNNYVTLERRRNWNQNNVSCIPLGSYDFTLTNSGIGLACNPDITELPELHEVPGGRGYRMNNGTRDPIRMHNGNQPFRSDGEPAIRGCILIGTDYNPNQNENWINLSCIRVSELVNIYNDI